MSPMTCPPAALQSAAVIDVPSGAGDGSSAEPVSLPAPTGSGGGDCLPPHAAITNENTKGYVVIDALRFVPVK